MIKIHSFFNKISLLKNFSIASILLLSNVFQFDSKTLAQQQLGFVIYDNITDIPIFDDGEHDQNKERWMIELENYEVKRFLDQEVKYIISGNFKYTPFTEISPNIKETKIEVDNLIIEYQGNDFGANLELQIRYDSPGDKLNSWVSSLEYQGEWNNSVSEGIFQDETTIFYSYFNGSFPNTLTPELPSSIEIARGMSVNERPFGNEPSQLMFEFENSKNILNNPLNAPLITGVGINITPRTTETWNLQIQKLSAKTITKTSEPKSLINLLVLGIISIILTFKK